MQNKARYTSTDDKNRNTENVKTVIPKDAYAIFRYPHLKHLSVQLGENIMPRQGHSSEKTRKWVKKTSCCGNPGILEGKAQRSRSLSSVKASKSMNGHGRGGVTMKLGEKERRSKKKHSDDHATQKTRSSSATVTLERRVYATHLSKHCIFGSIQREH